MKIRAIILWHSTLFSRFLKQIAGTLLPLLNIQDILLIQLYKLQFIPFSFFSTATQTFWWHIACYIKVRIQPYTFYRYFWMIALPRTYDLERGGYW